MNAKKLWISTAALSIALSLGFSQTEAFAKNHGNGHGHGHGKHDGDWKGNGKRNGSSNWNGDFNRSALIESLNGRGGNLFTQAQYQQLRSRSLPPGIRKQLARGKGLPPGFQNSAYILPSNWNSRFNLPPYARVGVYDDDAVIYNTQNNTILDILSNIF